MIRLQIQINHKESLRVKGYETENQYLDIGARQSLPVIYTTVYNFQAVYKYQCKKYKTIFGIMYINKNDWCISCIKEILREYNLERIKLTSYTK